MRSLILLLFLWILNLQDNPKAIITIEVIAPSTDDTTHIFIAGNNLQMGHWHPAKVPLKNMGSHTWKKDFEFPIGTAIEYKITRGSYDKEAADHTGRPFSNFELKVRGDSTVRQVINYWKKENHRPAGQITGEVRYHSNLSADSLLDRDIIVWLPPDYKNHGDQRYPVLYMQDGQNIFDPKTAAFSTDWQMDETADSLIRSGEIEPLIIVGIYNSEQRAAEYHPTVTGKVYRNFIIHTLKPFIDKTYRTKQGPEYCAVGGASSGGILAFMVAWENPQVFSTAICMSAPFKYDDIDYVKNVIDYKGKKKRIQIYMDNGDNALDQKLQPGINEMMAALDKKGYKKGIDYFWVKDKKAGHNEIAWAKRVPAILKLFYRK